MKSKKDVAAFIKTKIDANDRITPADHARYGTSFSVAESMMEGVARPLWGVIFLHLSGEDHGINYEAINRKILEGCTPQSEAYWGEPGDCSHHLCEMPPIALYLALCREKSWDVLPTEQREMLADYLRNIGRLRLVNNNWLYFRILVMTALHLLGDTPAPTEICSEDFQRIDSFYRGDGWYADGNSDQFDYYNAWAFHFYSLLYVWLEDKDSERCQVFRERAAAFAKSYIYLFSVRGNAVLYGRSLTYRFAQVSFWAMAVASRTDLDLPLGVIKGIILRNLRSWQDEKLLPGTMPESYNGVSSSLWALKAAAVLLAPETFWEEDELPLPELKPLLLLPSAKKTIARDGGEVILYPHGVERYGTHFPFGQEKYTKFAYSTLSGFCAPMPIDETDLRAHISDNDMVVKAGNDYLRRHNVTAMAHGEVLVSEWRPCRGVKIKTFVFPGAPWHVRVHRVSAIRKITIYESGFAIDASASDVVAETIGDGCKKVTLKFVNSSVRYPRSEVQTLIYSIKPGRSWLTSMFYIGVQKSKDKPNVKLAGENIEVIFPNGYCLRYD